MCVIFHSVLKSSNEALINTATSFHTITYTVAKQGTGNNAHSHHGTSTKAAAVAHLETKLAGQRFIYR